jgi:hypothetical protein
MVMGCTIGADWMVVVVPIAMIPINKWIYAMIWTPPRRPIAPIVRRMPTYPRWSPEPIVDIRAIDINRFDDIVGTIDILIAYDLNCDLIGLLIFFYKDRCYILVDIFSQDCLDNHQVAIAIGSFYNTQVVNFSIRIEVKVGKSRVRVVEQLLELFEVFSLTEESCNSLEIKVF